MIRLLMIMALLFVTLTGCSKETTSETEERLRSERDALQEDIQEVRGERDALQDRTAYWERQAALVAACDTMPTCKSEWVSDQRERLNESAVDWHGQGSGWFWALIGLQLAGIGIPMVLISLFAMVLYLHWVRPKRESVAAARTSVYEADQRTAAAERRLQDVGAQVAESERELATLREEIDDAQGELETLQGKIDEGKTVLAALQGFD